jgi:purine-cytosine permease-like protein
MPVESVAAYINNTLTFVLFLLACSILFFVILAVSFFLRKRVLGRNREMSCKKTDDREGGKSFTVTDPFLKRRDAVLGMAFILVFLSLILVLASYYFSLDMVMGMAVYIISFIVLSIIIILVYMLRWGAPDK